MNQPNAAAPITDKASRLDVFAPTPPDGKLRFQVDMSVDLRDLATWPPATLDAFMRGMALVITAESAGCSE